MFANDFWICLSVCYAILQLASLILNYCFEDKKKYILKLPYTKNGFILLFRRAKHSTYLYIHTYIYMYI